MRITHVPPSDYWIQKLENVHPESIRWSLYDKKEHIHSNPLSFWVVDDDEGNDIYLGEFLISKIDDTSVMLDSISSLEKGLGNHMWRYLIELLPSNNIKYAYGDARPGTSWYLAKKYGAEQTGISINHGNTEEDYIKFYIKF